jgi:acetylaranotin biosynthesis cluster protein L
MVNFYIAYTAPINPTSASPPLTRPQVWSGLQRKIRFAQEFVPSIIGCTVLSDAATTVVRDVEFKRGFGPPGKVREVCRSFAPSWVDFEQTDGSTVKNVVSDGADGALYLTYVFEWRHEGLEEGSAEASEVEERHRKVCVAATMLSKLKLTNKERRSRLPRWQWSHLLTASEQWSRMD